jgi:hypothetical protein
MARESGDPLREDSSMIHLSQDGHESMRARKSSIYTLFILGN